MRLTRQVLANRRQRVIFYARVADLRLLDLLEFYAEDIKMLEQLGYEVTRTNSVRVAAAADGDLLFAWWFHTSWLPALAWRLRRRPVILTGTVDLAVSTSTGRLRRAGRVGLSKVAVHLATANVALSTIERAALRRIGAPRLECIPLAVDTDFFRPASKEVTPTAVMVAQINPLSIQRKGVDTAVLAAEIVRRTHPTFRLVLAGPLTPEGRRFLDDLGAGSDGVEVVGEVSREEKHGLLASAWCALQPSVYEGFGLSVLEAMSCGTAPIGSTTGALPEVIGTAGILVPPVDPSALAAAIIELLDDPDRRTELAAAARARALEFRRAVHTDRYAAVVDRATAGRRG
jgi:glycosyltransferase involved in cell wall biosynthesis